jgi:hypothetical protein
VQQTTALLDHLVGAGDRLTERDLGELLAPAIEKRVDIDRLSLPGVGARSQRLRPTRGRCWHARYAAGNRDCGSAVMLPRTPRPLWLPSAAYAVSLFI